MKNAPLQYGLVLVGAWLATLGACGRTEPEVEGTYGSGASYGQGGDETANTGGTLQGGTSGASNSVGGARTGGTNGAGGARGGSSPTTGGTQGHGGDIISNGGGVQTGGTGGTGVGGSEVAGTAGNIAETGGTFFGGGTSSGGESGNATGGDTNETGGSANGGTGGSNATGGTGATTGGSAGNATGGSSGMPSGISCDSMRCDASASVCCKRRGSPSTCEPAGTMCSSGATLNCSGSSTCAQGDVCCFHLNQSLCQATCDVSVGSPGDPPTILLCDSDADCGAGQVCVIAPRGIAYCAMSQ